MSADRSTIGRTSRRRGADAERTIVTYLRNNGAPDARRYLAGDGRQPGDIDWHPLVCLEVKDVKNTTWPTWCRQAQSQAGAGMIPAVVRRTRGEPDPGQWPCRWQMTTGMHAVGATTRDMAGCHGWWVETTFAHLVAMVQELDR